MLVFAVAPATHPQFLGQAFVEHANPDCVIIRSSDFVTFAATMHRKHPFSKPWDSWSGPLLLWGLPIPEGSSVCLPLRFPSGLRFGKDSEKLPRPRGFENGISQFSFFVHVQPPELIPEVGRRNSDFTGEKSAGPAHPTTGPWG